MTALSLSLIFAAMIPAEDPNPNVPNADDPSSDDLLDLQETAHGRPLAGLAADHLARLRRDEAALLTDLQSLPPEHSATRYAAQLKEDLRTTRQRIAEYQHQLGNQN